MRHRRTGRKLGRTSAHRKAMLRNMVTSLLEHGRIHTTTPKAKELRPLAERLITLGKRGDLHARRRALRVVRDPRVVHRLFKEIAPRYQGRTGGYVRVVHMGRRKGDGAWLSMVELIP